MDADGGRREALMFGWLEPDGEKFDRAQDTSDAILVSTPEGQALPQFGIRFQIGRIEVANITGGPVDVEPLPTAREWRGLILGYLHAGSLTITQESRTLALSAGQFVFYTGAQRYRITADGPHEFLVVRIPTASIALRHSHFADAIATDLSATPSAPLLRALLEELSRLTVPPSLAAGAHVSDALIAAAHAVIADSRHPGSAAVTSRFHAFVLWLEDHLADDGLSAEDVAQAHFVSTRYVRRVFAANGTTVSALIRQRRLEQIRNDLVDPAYRDTPIRTVAERWGLADPAVFSRAFARQFGLPPRRYRALHMRQGQPDARDWHQPAIEPTPEPAGPVGG
ncbi:helix-turn-helix domain-containing protein [Microbacterium sp. NPDC076895]|uniref:helix-turn-helix domain-containing protein n=1 Tax=Microbacterium sp. NPDC076895 TaxID=3154957 RepID=UPI003419805C